MKESFSNVKSVRVLASGVLDALGCLRCVPSLLGAGGTCASGQSIGRPVHSFGDDGSEPRSPLGLLALTPVRRRATQLAR
jgi:hypothetical protein